MPNFAMHAIAKILFVLDSRYIGDTPYQVWFDLDNSLIRWKNLFLKFTNGEIRKFP